MKTNNTGMNETTMMEWKEDKVLRWSSPFPRVSEELLCTPLRE